MDNIIFGLNEKPLLPSDKISEIVTGFGHLVENPETLGMKIEVPTDDGKNNFAILIFREEDLKNLKYEPPGD